LKLVHEALPYRKIVGIVRKGRALTRFHEMLSGKAHRTPVSS
jgi:hypothetical protein